MISRRTACVFTGAAILGLNGRHVLAQQPLAAPKEKAILAISGKISITNQSGAAIFDLAMLEAMGLTTIETMTPWYTSKVKFEGVLMTKILKAVGATGEKLTISALNDYKTEIPVEDFEKFGTILAVKRDGQYMPVSDKGPLFVVYPYDANPELKTQKYFSRSAWQVAKIEVK
jgi:hypothetical protein